MEALSSAIKALAALNDELIAATASHDEDRVGVLLDEIARNERLRNRLVHQRTLVEPATSYATTLPLRDKVISTLEIVGHPAAAKLLADVCFAFVGDRLATATLSSLRRDERRRFAASQGTRTQDQYVVSALSFDTISPVRGTLALSSWPLRHRLIGPSSPRANLLKITSRLSEFRDRAVDPAAANRLLLRLARSIPGAVENPVVGGTARAMTVDLNRLRTAVEAELDQIAGRDEIDRESAAARIGPLDPGQVIFGVTPVAGQSLRTADAGGWAKVVS
jgi:hypothetical protein